MNIYLYNSSKKDSMFQRRFQLPEARNLKNNDIDTPQFQQAIEKFKLSYSDLMNIEEDIDNLESTMRQLTQMTIREINILRQQFNTTTAEVAQLTDTSFADRTMAQVKSQMRSDLGT